MDRTLASTGPARPVSTSSEDASVGLRPDAGSLHDRTLGGCVRLVAAVEAQASVFDQTLGHFMTERSVGASGPTDVAAHSGDVE